MPLICSDCANIAEEDEPYCSVCGADLVWHLRHRGLAAAVRTEVVVSRLRMNCVCYGEQLRYDPVEDSMSTFFRCSQFPQRIDCVACPVCSGCGQMRCTCGCLGITIEAKIKGTVIETVPSRKRLVG